MSKNLPAKPDQQDPWPTEYWPEGKGTSKYSDEVLGEIVRERAETNDSLDIIFKRHGMSATHGYRLRNKLPRFNQALQIADEVRDQRLRDQILEIADEPLAENTEDDPDATARDIAHRKLKMQARKDVMAARRARKEKGFETLNINVDGGDKDSPPTVNIQVVNYGDA